MPIFTLFQKSAQELKSARCLALSAMFIALNITLDLLNVRVQLTPELRITFGFLCNAVIGMLFGPTVGCMAGLCTDVLGYLANQGGGAYFPGYTVTAMVGGVLWGLWLYQPGRLSGKTTLRSRRARLLCVIGAKASVNLLCNICLNTVWLSIMYHKAASVLLPARALKNVLLLPLECVLLFAMTELALRVYLSRQPSCHG